MRNALIVVGLLSLGGCKKDAVEAPKPVAPAKLAPLTPSGDGTLTGTIAERIEAPNYTYFRLTAGQGEAWVAVPTSTLQVGAQVNVMNAQPMPGFESKTLQRKWDLIYFGATAEAASGATPPAAPPHPTAAPVPTELQNVKVEKATGPGAKTIAEVYAEHTQLKDQSVSVRGQVVKVTSGVLGKNWVHLRDGSGSDAAKDNDLTVTTTATVAIGETVTATGPVHLDVKLGGGYAFPVIIEDAAVTK